MSKWAIVWVVGIAGCKGGLDIEASLPNDMAAERSGSVVVDGKLGVTTADQSLVIERARIMVGELEVEGRTEASEFEAGPAVVEIGLDGQPTTIAIADVPAGKYEELGLEFAVGARGDIDGSEDFGGASPASIIVDGTLDGQRFTYRSRFAPEVEFALHGVEVRDGEMATVTITFDVSAWFLDANGRILDPSNETNRAAIDAAIKDSLALHASELEIGDDEEEDGEEDED